jgi:hypothetical protein
MPTEFSVNTTARGTSDATLKMRYLHARVIEAWLLALLRASSLPTTESANGQQFKVAVEHLFFFHRLLSAPALSNAR